MGALLKTILGIVAFLPVQAIASSEQIDLSGLPATALAQFGALGWVVLELVKSMRAFRETIEKMQAMEERLLEVLERLEKKKD
jgi:uncharacterized membrane protein